MKERRACALSRKNALNYDTCRKKESERAVRKESFFPSFGTENISSPVHKEKLLSARHSLPNFLFYPVSYIFCSSSFLILLFRFFPVRV